MRPRPAAFGLWAALTFSCAVVVHGVIHAVGTRAFVWDSPAHVAMLAVALGLLAVVAAPLGLVGRAREVAALAGSTPVSIDALEAIEGDAAIRAVVITGEGGTFCAGGDISGMDVADLAAGLWRDLAPLGAEALSQVVILLPNRRTLRDLTSAFMDFAGGGALMPPQMRALGDLDEGEPPFEPGEAAFDLPPAIEAFRQIQKIAPLAKSLLEES